MFDVSRDVSRALAKERRNACEQMKAEATEWVCALVFQALHDKWRYGRRRFARMNASWPQRLHNGETYCIDHWQAEMEDKCKLNWQKLKRFGEQITRCVTKGKTDKKTQEEVQIVAMGVLVVVLYELVQNYGFGKKRITDLQNKVMDMMRLVSKDDVPIYEFMECMYQECGVQFESMDEYLKTHERPMIYG